MAKIIKTCEIMTTESALKNEFVEAQKDNITYNLQKLNYESQSMASNAKKLLQNLQYLKGEMQGMLNQIEENVQQFKDTLDSNLNLVLSMVSEKQLNLDATLSDCYQIITDLVETFFNIGYQSEKDISTLEAKVGALETQLKEMVKDLSLNEYDSDSNEPQWCVNNECRLTMMKNVSVGSVLMKFCNGNNFEKSQFIKYMSDLFKQYQVDDMYWVDLTANQLSGLARDWWKTQYKNQFMTWSQFVDVFMKESFNCESNDIDGILDFPTVEENQEITWQLRQTISICKPLQTLENDDNFSEL